MRELVKTLLGQTNLGRLDYFRFPTASDGWGGAFNGQHHRQAMFREIVIGCRVTAVVETGTFRGTTTAFMAKTSGLPLFTVEYDPRNYGFARQRLARVPSIETALGDSRAFLRDLLASGRLPPGPCFFYLDAHWGTDVPLLQEIDIIFSTRPDAIVMIDDFQVPDDAGYGFDSYGEESELTYRYIAPAVSRHGLAGFVPALASDQETGMRRGSVVLVADHPLIALVAGFESMRPVEH